MRTESAASHPRKPRIVLMGEFSSGKSTLSNILLGGPILPTQVTATRLPPVYVSYGEPSAYAIALDGTRIEADLSDLSNLSPETTASLHVTMMSDTLELCDLLDMPGISDPNMPADTWDAVVGPADHVIWCTHATQAWRQSEAAMWDRIRPATSGVNLLLVTQFDKLRNARDRARVLSRIAGETAGKFTALYPVCLLDALAAGDDVDLWKASGADEFMEHLVDILLSLPRPADADTATTATAQLFDRNANVIDISRPAPAALADQHVSGGLVDAQSASQVMPRRVRAKAADPGKRAPRPATAPGWLEAIELGPQ